MDEKTDKSVESVAADDMPERAASDPAEASPSEAEVDLQASKTSVKADSDLKDGVNDEVPMTSDESFPPAALAGQEEPGQNDIAIDPEWGDVLNAEEEASGKDEVCPSPPSEESPADVADAGQAGTGTQATPEVATGKDPVIEDPQAVVTPEQLDNARALVASTLFAKDRPRSGEADTVIGTYASTLAAVATDEAELDDERSQLTRLTGSFHETSLQSEKVRFQKAKAAIVEQVGVYKKVFEELERLVGDVHKELEQRNVNSPEVQATSEGLQAGLMNYHKGIEIIHRMLTRALDRKKELAAEPPQQLVEELPTDDLTGFDSVQDLAKELAERFHTLRDANYHAIQDAEGLADKFRNNLLQTVKTLLSAIDGIDSGLASEPQTHGQLLELVDSESDQQALVQGWTGCYERLNSLADGFFERTGIEAHTVEAGSPFDPESMDPQGTVENPDLNDEDVAAVIRRGFSLEGKVVRPILVDVVRNP